MMYPIEISQDNFFEFLQCNISKLAIDISVLRNQSKANTVEMCREFCSKVTLKDFFIALEGDYQSYLNEQTDLLVSHCSGLNLQFGSARKALNIFFRHICYNGFIQKKYLTEIDLISTNSIISKLEIPMDKKVAHCLLNAHGRRANEWKTIKGISAEENQKYQQMAKQIAEKKNIARIHLDLQYWTLNCNNNESDLPDLKGISVNYLNKQVVNEADKAFSDNGHNASTIEQWRKEHNRKKQ